jgi:sulfatase modifying factor 1
MIIMRSQWVALFAGLAVVSPSRAHAAARVAAPARRAATASAMARIPAGSYRPLFATSTSSLVHVAAFDIDREPVTREQYLRFVRANPRWARGVVPPSFAEGHYLAEWPSATNAGNATDLRRPVTSVSWFAAKVYCAAQGKRLPTVDEWELAAASISARRGSNARDDRRTLLALYAARKPGVPDTIGVTAPNAYGVRDLHGVVWEWTLDFNPAAAADDSHASQGHHHDHEHHLFCASAAIGATDATDYPAFARYAMRAGLTTRSTVAGVGFRCASSIAS